MATTAAEEEYNALFTSRLRLSRHPDDETSSDDGNDAVPEAKTRMGSSRSFSTATTVTNNTLARSSRSSNYIHATSRLDDPSDSEDEHDDASDTEEPTHRNVYRQKSNTYYLPRNYTPNANTGPKGVIADAQAYEQAKKGGPNPSYHRTVDLAAPRMQNSELVTRDGEEDEDDIDVVGEAEVMRIWRAKRLLEMQNEELLQQQQSRSTWEAGMGRVELVDGNGFLQAVDGAPKHMLVVVYVYDDKLLLSEAYQSHLRTIAADYNSVRFVALHFKEAEMEHAGIPALIAYRDGTKIGALVPLGDEVPFTSDVLTTLKNAMWDHGMLE